jgi:hypothetical protein
LASEEPRNPAAPVMRKFIICIIRGIDDFSESDGNHEAKAI